jgi:hypothetical protein
MRLVAIRACLIPGVRPAIRRRDRLVARRAGRRCSVRVTGVWLMTRRASFVTAVAHFDLTVAALACAFGRAGRMRRMTTRATPVSIDRRRHECRLLTMAARTRPCSGGKLVGLVASRTRVVHREGRRRYLLVTSRARLHGCNAGFVSSMAIEATFATGVRGMLIRPLLVAGLAVLWRNSGLLVRFMAVLALGRDVLRDRLSGALHIAMAIETRGCRCRRKGMADEAIRFRRAPCVRVRKLLCVASSTNARAGARESCSIHVVAFPTCNRSFTDVGFVSGAGPELCPRWRHDLSGHGDWPPRQQAIEPGDSRGNEHQHHGARREQRTPAGSHGTPA